MHRKRGLVAASLSNRIYPPLHSVYSVHSVVKRFFNHGMHGLASDVHRTILDARDAARQEMAGEQKTAAPCGAAVVCGLGIERD